MPKKTLKKPGLQNLIVSSPLLISRSVGSGITKREKYSLAVQSFGHNTKPPHISDDDDWTKVCIDAWKKISPVETKFDNLERIAVEILEASNLPVIGENLVDLVESKGFKERLSREWYASKILVGIYAMRGCIEKGKPRAAVLIAFELGMLATEMEIRFEVVSGYTRKGGSQKKRLLAVCSFIRSRLRPALTARELWNQIPRDSDDGFSKALHIGQLRLLIDERGRLVVKKNQVSKHGGVKEWGEIGSLSYASFRKYVTDVRKPIHR